MRNRKVHIQFWLNEDEAKILSENVELSGLTKSAFLRSLSGCKMPRENPPPDYYDLAKQMYAIGNNLNQLTKIAHVTHAVVEDTVKDMAEKHSQLILRIDRKIREPYPIQIIVNTGKKKESPTNGDS